MLVSNCLTNINTESRPIYGKNIDSKRPAVHFTGALKCDTAQISQAAKDLKINNILDKFANFSVEEYKALSIKEINALREKYERLVKEMGFPYGHSFRTIEKDHDVISTDMMNSLNAKYGEGNYRVVTIGRSLSSVGKVLGYKIGEENVVNMPLSGAAAYLKDFMLKDAVNGEYTPRLLKFLKEHGLDRETIEKSGKKYVIMDYCYTGESLKGAHKLLTQDCFMGNENVTSLSVNECIPKYHCQYIRALLRCKYKDFSFVKKNRDIDVDRGFIDTKYADLSTRLMWFKLLDNHMTKIAEDVEPKKEHGIKALFSQVKGLLHKKTEK